MTRNFLRQALVVFAGCAISLFGNAVFAQGATVQLVDSNCSDFTLSGPVGARVLTCVPIVNNNPPTCTVTGASSAANGSQVTLTAACAPAATSWVWTQDVGGTGCSQSTQSTCSDTQTNLTVNYKVTGSNGNGAGPQSPAFPVVWSNNIIAPSGCSVAYSPGSSVAANTQVTMTANCTTGTQPFTYAWTGGPVAGQTVQSAVGTFASSGNGNVTISNAQGQQQKNWAVTVGGGGGPINCTGPGIAGTIVVTAGWASDWVYDTWSTTPVGPNDIVVVKITVPAGVQATKSGSLNVVNQNGPVVFVYGSLSDQPCDMTGGTLLEKKVGIPPTFADTSSAMITTYAGTGGNSGNVVLVPGNTYYFNMTHVIPNSGGQTSCAGYSTCDVRFEFKKPAGT